MTCIALHGIAKSYGEKRVLEGIDLDIESGEFLSLVGPSGCGKSTLLRIISGLEPQDQGSVTIDGESVDHVRAADRDIAMVFQSYALYPHLTVAANIALPRTMRDLPAAYRLPIASRLLPGARRARARIERQVRELAEALGLGGLLDRRPGQLSGGQRQRVALARAMIRNPRAFLMDEPLSNLDAGMRAQTRLEIAELHRRLGKTMVFVTHDQAEAMTLSTRIVVLFDGRIQQAASPRIIYEAPATLAVAAFFGEPKINRLDARTLAGGAVDVEGLVVPRAAPGGETVAVAAVRPEHLRIVTDRGAPGWDARLVRIEYLGAAAFVHARLPDGRALTAATGGEEAALLGDDVVRLAPRLDRVLFFDDSGRRVASPSRPAVPILTGALA